MSWTRTQTDKQPRACPLGREGYFLPFVSYLYGWHLALLWHLAYPMVSATRVLLLFTINLL
jgi:hypothetical protein